MEATFDVIIDRRLLFSSSSIREYSLKCFGEADMAFLPKYSLNSAKNLITLG